MVAQYSDGHRHRQPGRKERPGGAGQSYLQVAGRNGQGGVYQRMQPHGGGGDRVLQEPSAEGDHRSPVGALRGNPARIDTISSSSTDTPLIRISSKTVTWAVMAVRRTATTLNLPVIGTSSPLHRAGIGLARIQHDVQEAEVFK